MEEVEYWKERYRTTLERNRQLLDRATAAEAEVEKLKERNAALARQLASWGQVED